MKEKRRRRKNPKMNQETTKYDKILQELKSDYSALLDKYLPKLHQACHEDISLKVLSHMEIVKKIRQDCINICSEASERITLAGEGEEDVIKEILEYNYDMADIKYMKEVIMTSYIVVSFMSYSLCHKPSTLQRVVYYTISENYSKTRIVTKNSSKYTDFMAIKYR